MISENGDYLTWATDTSRTMEELYGIELGTDLRLYFTLTEKAAVVMDRDRNLSEMFLEMKAEDEEPLRR